MSRTMRVVLPIAIIVVALILAQILISNRAPPPRQAPSPPRPLVQVQELKPQSYQVMVPSRGTVEAHTRGNLVAQVGGKIVEVNSSFRDGGFFRAGETLVQIDQRDYRLAVTMAEAERARAQQALSEEQARAAQARRDWERLGGGGEPNDLALRKPQMAGARATLAAADASLAQARLNLERTRISVPYEGRVLSKQADLGQVISPGTPVGEVYATDKVEVQLPLTNQQLARLQLPEQYLGEAEQPGPPVTLIAASGERSHSWEGRIVRTAGAIDRNSRQTFVVAQVDDPYARRDDSAPPLKVGQYVEARIHGETLKDVYVIPRAALRGADLAYVVDVDSQLQERRLDIAWQDDHAVVVRAGLAAGERLVTTVPGAAAPGMLVRLQDPLAREPRVAESEAPAAKP